MHSIIIFYAELIFLYTLFTAGVRQYLLTCIVSETWEKVVT